MDTIKLNVKTDDKDKLEFIEIRLREAADKIKEANSILGELTSKDLNINLTVEI